MSWGFYALASLALVAATFAWAYMSGSAETKKPDVPPPAAAKKEEEPAPLREFTLAQLAGCKGEGSSPLYVAADGWVFDMDSHPGGRDFYGPGGGYHCFAGVDATIGLATMSTVPSAWGARDRASLSDSEEETLANWVDRFRAKYKCIGVLVEGSSARSAKSAAAASGGAGAKSKAN